MPSLLLCDMIVRVPTRRAASGFFVCVLFRIRARLESASNIAATVLCYHVIVFIVLADATDSAALIVLNLDANWGGNETRPRNATCLFNDTVTRLFGDAFARGEIVHTNNPDRAGEEVDLGRPLALGGGDFLLVSLEVPVQPQSPPFHLGVDVGLLSAGAALCLFAFLKSRWPGKRQALDYSISDAAARSQSPKLLLIVFTAVNLMTYVDRGFLSVCFSFVPFSLLALLPPCSSPCLLPSASFSVASFVVFFPALSPLRCYA